MKNIFTKIKNWWQQDHEAVARKRILNQMIDNKKMSLLPPLIIPDDPKIRRILDELYTVEDSINMKNIFKNKRCKICKRKLNQSNKPDTKDCGGDCLRCMAEIGEDSDCIKELNNNIK